MAAHGNTGMESSAFARSHHLTARAADWPFQECVAGMPLTAFAPRGLIACAKCLTSGSAAVLAGGRSGDPLDSALDPERFFR